METRSSYRSVSPELTALKSHLSALNQALDNLKSNPTLLHLANYSHLLLSLIISLPEEQKTEYNYLESLTKDITKATQDIINVESEPLTSTKYTRKKLDNHLQTSQVTYLTLLESLSQFYRPNIESLINGILEKAAKKPDQSLCDKIIIKLNLILENQPLGNLLNDHELDYELEHILTQLNSTVSEVIDKYAIKGLIDDLTNIEAFCFNQSEMEKVSKSLDGDPTYHPKRFQQTKEEISTPLIETYLTPPPPYIATANLSPEPELSELSEISTPTAVREEIPGLEPYDFHNEPTRIVDPEKLPKGTVRRKPQESQLPKDDNKPHKRKDPSQIFDSQI